MRASSPLLYGRAFAVACSIARVNLSAMTMALRQKWSARLDATLRGGDQVALV